MTKWKVDFLEAWNQATSIEEFLETYPRKIKQKTARDASSVLRKEGHTLKKLGSRRLNEMRKMRAAGMTYQAIGDAFGITHQAVQYQLKKPS